ncbi:Uncharacterised protein [Pantoea agglomerans]|uniref:Uncharacterized protein n=1 Tax=Enterobacter agglomerans TaxID=549 RepID=A0A379ANQ0_ENTAG|nr:Uncharacterised protein [Pantoea agglomerans]
MMAADLWRAQKSRRTGASRFLPPGGNIFVLPYGDVTEPQRERFEENLMKDPHFIKRGLDTVLNYPVW